MRTTPISGPIARMANAHGHPALRTTSGITWIAPVVSRNPSDTCSVSAVPTACAGTLSVTSTLNCAESAMMKNPQRRASGATIHSDRPKVRPTSAQQLALITSARLTSGARPMRSATRPPQMHPAPPTAITPNESNATSGDDDAVSAWVSRATVAATKYGIQVQ